jgi:hypothetical protein
LDPITLILLVVPGEAPDAAVQAMTASARTVLGTSAEVRLMDGGAESDAATQAAMVRAHGSAVAQIRWNAGRVHIHLYTVKNQRWTERDIGFSGSDAPSERGRTVGFAVASMMPDFVPLPPPPPDLPPVRDPPIVVPPPPDVVPPPPLPPRRWYGAVDVGATSGLALKGYGGGFGLGLAATWYTVPHLGLRFGGLARFGEISVSQSTTFSANGSVGVAWTFGGDGGSALGHFGIGGRVDLLAQYLSVSHLSSDDPVAARKSRWLPGADFLLEGSFHFAPSGAIVLGLGGEVVFGSTDVYVKDQLSATLTPFRAVAEIGLRARF